MIPVRVERVAGADPDSGFLLVGMLTTAVQVAGPARPGDVDLICEHGDDLLYAGKWCVPTFGAVARALRSLSSAPGGVVFAGHRWTSDGPDPPVVTPRGRKLQDVPLPS